MAHMAAVLRTLELGPRFSNPERFCAGKLQTRWLAASAQDSKATETVQCVGLRGAWLQARTHGLYGTSTPIMENEIWRKLVVYL